MTQFKTYYLKDDKNKIIVRSWFCLNLFNFKYNFQQVFIFNLFEKLFKS